MASFRSNRVARKPYSRPVPRPNIDGQWLHDMAEDDNTPLNGGLNSRPRTPAAVAGPSTRLVVTNLHYEISPKDLTAIFGQIGTLTSEPHIRYDRSGRSSGTAIVSFETLAEATRAKNQYNGILAKGQPMSIAFDVTPPRQPRARSSSAPTTSSLLNRIQKPPLLDRLSGSKDDSALPRAPRGVGPIRTARGAQKPARGGKAAAPKKPKTPKTAAELDKELDAFMGDNDSAPAPAAAAPAQDVEMA
ncbi:THO complex subunit 4-A [Mycena venus]|uniref:THO complex subunit 4-A n=1 Tax=Mycena venus TaxID=2733690 RepID=A0A8H6YK91_9AGAR|nr:THO complex subunit 4-A [Mycena venus]